MTTHRTQDYQAVRLHNTGLHLSGRDATTPAVSKPSIVGIWRLVERLHVGAWCEIYKAQPADAVGSPRLDYAVKIVRADCEDHSEAVRQIRAEAEVTSLAKHPHLVTILDSNLHGARPFIVMPRMETRTIATVLHANPKQAASQPVPVALWWARQAAQALHVIHEANWVHGDVSPQNLLVDARGHVTVIDLGFAQPTGSSFDLKYRGTPDYAAPELLTGVPATPASDVYSLGKVLEKLLADEPRRPASVETLLQSMLTPKPESRPITKDLCEQLLQLEIETLHLHINPRELFPKKVA